MEIFHNYGKLYIVINNQMIIGEYKSYIEGIREVSSKEELGVFIVQYCTGHKSGYTNFIFFQCVAL